MQAAYILHVFLQMASFMTANGYATGLGLLLTVECTSIKLTKNSTSPSAVITMYPVKFTFRIHQKSNKSLFDIC